MIKTKQGNEFEIVISFVEKDGSIKKGDAIKVTAGACGTWIIKIINSSGDYIKNNRFLLRALNYNFGHMLQNSNPMARDYVTLRSNSTAKFKLITDTRSFSGVCKILITEGVFEKDEELELTIGNREFGSVGSEIYWTVTDAELSVLLEKNDNENSIDLKLGTAYFEVVADSHISLIRILGPTVAAINEPFDLHVGVFDRGGNIIDNYQGKVQFAQIEGLCGLEHEYIFDKKDNGLLIIKNVVINKPDIYRIKLKERETQKSYMSNPIVVFDKPQKYIYWGDLHAHGWGDCTMLLMNKRTSKVDPLSRHNQAKQIGRLDFSAIGPMSYPKTNREEIWQAYIQACNQTETKGKYIPFLSYEAHPPEGDRNVIFKYLDEEMPPDCFVSMEEVEKKYSNRDDVILEVHIGGSTPKWDLYSTNKERMVEISSAFGNAEWLLIKSLKYGYKPAVCGSSDLHMGLMGGPRTVETARGRFGSILNQRDSAYGTGPLTAVYAAELSRVELWDSFAKRATYATSGERIFIDFKCNGISNGSFAKRPLNICLELKCYGTNIIDKIDIICGENIIRTYKPNKMDFEQRDTINQDLIKGDWLYMRVHQIDDNWAWTSPIFIEPELPRWNDSYDNIDPMEAKTAEKFLVDVIKYLKIEEDYSMFDEIRAVKIIKQMTASCALFYCYFGTDRHKMSIRWYYEYEIPKIRFDWGWTDMGIKDDSAKQLYKRNKEK